MLRERGVVIYKELHRAVEKIPYPRLWELELPLGDNIKIVGHSPGGVETAQLVNHQDLSSDPRIHESFLESWHIVVDLHLGVSVVWV